MLEKTTKKKELVYKTNILPFPIPKIQNNNDRQLAIIKLFTTTLGLSHHKIEKSLQTHSK